MNCRNLFQNIITISAVFLLALVSKPVLAQADDSMGADEINEMVDDLGGGQNQSNSDSGMNGNGNTTTASTASTSSTFSGLAPTNDFSSHAGTFDDDNENEEDGVDKEIGQSGAQDAMYDHYSGRTPEPEADLNKSTRIPSGDAYNAPFVKKHAKKKHVVKKNKKSKHKVAKNSKKKKKIAKVKRKKSKDRRIASRKSSSKRRYR